MQRGFFYGKNKLGVHRLAYTEWGVAGRKPPIICLHGLTRNGRDFDILAAALEKAGEHVYCPDMVGRGDSDWLADPAAYTYEQYLADITCFLMHIRAPHVDWVGTSMGGLLGLILASLPVSPIRRLVMNDVGPFLSADTLAYLAETVGWTKSFANEAELEHHMRQVHRGFGNLTNQQWRALTLTSAKKLEDGRLIPNYDPGIKEGLKPLKEDMSFWPYWATATAPVLVLRGAKSSVLTEPVAYRMTETGPKAKVVTISDTGHAPALMSEEQISIIQNFLA